MQSEVPRSDIVGAGDLAVAGVLLAAGGGRRMGRPKALIRAADGTAWVASAVDALTGGGCAPVVVVLGAQAGAVEALVPAGARVVVAQNWAAGMSASLIAGLRSLEQQAPAATAVIITLVDTPGVGAAAVRRLHALAGAGVLARACYAGHPGHPVLIGRDHWAELIETLTEGLTRDEGARGYLAGRDVVTLECSDVASGEDVDTADDLGRWSIS